MSHRMWSGRVVSNASADAGDLVPLPVALRQRAITDLHRTAFTFLLDGEQDAASLAYSELHAQSGAVAATLRKRLSPGDRVLLLAEPGLAYLSSFFGCLQAGAVAVTAYPPDPSRPSLTGQRVEAIARDSGAGLVLATRLVATMRGGLARSAPTAAGLDWLIFEDVPECGLDQAPDFSGGLDDVAMLQYTSGSTGEPRGVQLTHRNMAAQGQLLRDGYGMSIDSVVVSWNPLYHDMGLFGSVVAPLAVGCHSVLMSPLAFLARPLRWLRAITRYRATISGAPNFAFDLCVRKVAEEDVDQLELGSWIEAFNGSEPVRPETIDRFVAKFERCGFRRSAMNPSWGLAESTCAITGSARGRRPFSRRLARSAFDKGTAREPAQDEDAVVMVASGRPLGGHEVRIVEPETERELSDGSIGEVWLRGPCVSPGYWQRPEVNQQVFEARMADGTGPWLRAGDLGFLLNGNLFLFGRLKDTIIIRGRNLAAHDIERTVDTAHPSLREGCTAAFSVRRGGEEALAIVAEVRTDSPKVADVEAAVRGSVLAEHGVTPATVALIAARTLPKTSSGKIRRRATRTALEDGTLRLIAPGR